jgi:hypothetical protein
MGSSSAKNFNVASQSRSYIGHSFFVGVPLTDYSLFDIERIGYVTIWVFFDHNLELFHGKTLLNSRPSS